MAAVLRVSILGDMPGGEVWSVNPIYLAGGDFTLPYEDLIAIATAINSVTVPADMLATMNSNCHVTGVRLESRELTGELASVYEANRSVPATGGGSSVHPYQTSLVLSLRTAVAGGRGRGRLYWPATGVALTPSTMRVTNSVLTAFRTAFASYLTSLATAIETVVPCAELVVWSRTSGTAALVNRISAGDVCDVQRRRRDALPETIVTAVYP